MRRRFDAVVIGGDAEGLVAAIGLARSGRSVLLLESATELGGTCREIEFAPGFRAAPLAADIGYFAADIMRSVGLTVSSRPTVAIPLASLGEQGGEHESLLLHVNVD